ncbi:hypothetical protein [Acinetobacter silvestris]|uniref:Uncharacterized protein n=1 Tax=Acinetobacter silvestris TaxID=1977882 RepID=A0A1Y3CEP9_9GAMM|nr:hypothetical protein [Acinetobacter silvestris]OTG64826.1 hypothetical protein B9T28_11510 [Acinetobacter silvestris]
MDLFHVLLNIHEFANEQSIYVEQPWTLESTVMLCTNNTEIKLNVNNIIFEYFLEVVTVKALLTDLGIHHLCIRDCCQQIIEYALYES